MKYNLLVYNAMVVPVSYNVHITAFKANTKCASTIFICMIFRSRSKRLLVLVLFHTAYIEEIKKRTKIKELVGCGHQWNHIITKLSQ